jgi:AcrR family transcriptional regulator
MSEKVTAEADRRTEIVNAAALIIHRRGYDATSMNEIAEAVNLTKAGLYYYTRGKQDLLYMIIKWAMDLVETDILTPCREIKNPEERIRAIVKNHLEVMMVDGGAVTILTVEVDKLPTEKRSEINQRHRIYLDLVRNTLAELKDLGRLRPADPMIAALNMFATFFGVPRWYQQKGHLNQDDVSEEIDKYVLGALLKDR